MAGRRSSTADGLRFISYFSVFDGGIAQSFRAGSMAAASLAAIMAATCSSV